MTFPPDYLGGRTVPIYDDEFWRAFWLAIILIEE
jgi:hypothetical protein